MDGSEMMVSCNSQTGPSSSQPRCLVPIVSSRPDLRDDLVLDAREKGLVRRDMRFVLIPEVYMLQPAFQLAFSKGQPSR